MSIYVRTIHAIIAITALALVAAALPILTIDSARAAAALVPEAARPSVQSAADRASAMVSAHSQGSRVEDESARTPTTATYANPDGTWTIEAASGVVRSKVDDDEWVQINPELKPAGGSFEPVATPFDASYSDGGDRVIGSVATSNEKSISVRWEDVLTAPEVDGARLIYPNVAPRADLVVDSANDGFSFSVLMEEAPKPDAQQIEYRFPLQFEGLRAEARDNGSIIVRDGERIVAVITAPVMWDAANAGPDGRRHPVDATVEGSGSARTLVLRPDMSFLRDPSTSYPVTVDPTMVINTAGDTWIQSSGDTSSRYTSAELRVGSSDGGTTIARSLMQFDISPLSQVPAAVVTNAELRLSNFEAGACAGSAVRVSRITSGWTVPSVTWATQPTVTTQNAATSSQAFGATGCTAEDTMSFNLTAMVNDWIGGAWNPGVQIKSDNETALSGFRRVRSLENGDTAKAPKLVLTYNSYPGKPSALTIAPGNTYGSTNYVTSLTPSLSSTVTDPDGGAVRGYFEVRDSSGATVLWSGSSSWVTSGAQVSVTVPSGILANGTSYQVRSHSQDAALKSTVSTNRTVQVDTSAPTVAITATNYSNNVWAATMPASNTFTFNGPNDTAVFEAVLDGAPSTIGANASGDFSFPYTYVAEWHVFKVTPVDKAGNRGTITTFSFGSAAPGFTTPQQNNASTSAFPLDISAPPNATSAVISWRLQGEASWRNATEVTKAGASWAGTVTTAGGRAQTGQLLWKAGDEALGGATLEAPAVVNLRACFKYTAAADKCTYARTLQLVPSAFGDNYPVASLGPATVALYTGEAAITGVDAADSTAALGRSFSSFDSSTVDVGVFGPGWSQPDILTAHAGAEAQVVDNRSKDKSFVIVEPSSGAQTFAPVGSSTTSYEPLDPTGDATALTFTPAASGQPDKLELVRPLGTASVKTTWTLKASDTGGVPAWTVDSVDAPGTAADVQVASASQRPTFVRESDAAAATTCTAVTQTAGCRALVLTYSGTGSNTRLTSVARLVGASSPGAVATTTIANYTYDGSGKLSSVCSTAPAAGKPNLCTDYTYTTVLGRTLISGITPSGMKGWRFAYDASGRLLNVKRERPAGGDATWSVDYSLTPASSGLPNLSAGAAAEWGQTEVPTKVFAVYQPYAGAASVTKAELLYTTTEGIVTNVASYGPSGWLVDTEWHDSRGNVVQSLNSTGWARVQAAAIGDRPRVAAEASSYTVYNTWGGADVVGTRVVDEYGPVNDVTLRDGTRGTFRAHIKTWYDDDPAVDSALIATRPGSTGLGLVVKETRSASNASRTTDYESLSTKYGYDAIVVGDTKGWDLGVPTTVSRQVDASTWSTETTRYDASGREVETRRPGGASDGSGAGSDALTTRTIYYTASGSGACGGQPAWDGQICKIEPAAQPTGTKVPGTFVTNYDGDLRPTSVQEVVDGTITRTTTGSFDGLGRVISTTQQATGPDVANESITTSYGYDDDTGLPTTTSVGSSTVTRTYDTWGREVGYQDALGTTASTAYNDAGDIESFDDGTGTYIYTYDSNGWFTDVNSGGAGTFTYGYDSAGNVSTVTYPNGVVAERAYDRVGTPIGLTYRQGTTELLAFTATLAPDGTKGAESSAISSQAFVYDGLGRLNKVEDTRSGECTTRTYSFDSASNRASVSTYAPAATTRACQTTSSATTRTNSYDAAGRIRNSGYTYDTLGRTLTVPQSDSGPRAAGVLTATYRANDMVASLSQTTNLSGGGTASKAMTYGLDPAGRIHDIKTTTNGFETSRLRYRYAGESDSPAVVESSADAGTTWTATRYVVADYMGVSASTTGGTTTILLTDLGGDIVATMPAGAGASTLSSYEEADEFGNRFADSHERRYDWLGAHQRPRDALGDLVLMGARLYNPATGSFLSVDPVADANATPYAYPQDPVNQRDLNGKWPDFSCGWCLEKMWDGAMWGLKTGLSKFACTASGAAVIICSGVVSAVVAGVDYAGWKLLHGDKPSATKTGEKMISGFIKGIGGKSLLKKAAKPWRKYGRDIVSDVINAAKKVARKLPKGGTIAKAIDKIGGWILSKIDKLFA